jgi:DNA-binding transcriptional LysR family regulator
MINYRLIRHLWYFSIVAEEGNFRRAAERLGISQPPLTQQIKVLEHSLQLKLLDRSKRETTLTPHGAAILPEVQQLLDQAERLNLLVADARQGRLESLSIGSITSAILHILPGVIPRVREMYPNASIRVEEMNTSSGLEALARGQVQLAIGRFTTVNEPLKHRTLFTDRLDVALPRGHELLEREVIEIGDLAGYDWIHFPRRINPRNFDMVTTACHRAGFSPRLTHQVTNQLSLMAFVACGLGVALLPRSITSFYKGYVQFRPLNPELRIVTAAAAWLVETPLINCIVSLAGESDAMRASVLIPDQDK